MKYFKKGTQVFAFELNKSQDHLITSDMVRLTDAEAEAHINPPKTLADLKKDKENEIRQRFELDSNNAVSALGLKWNGGFDSAIKLDAAMRLSQAAGAPNVVFFDLTNNPHLLSYADALNVVINVAGSFQIHLTKKQDLFVQISKATINTINNIAW